MNIDQALILCGGKGTRLGERVRDLPKPMIPVGGRPVLDHIMDILHVAGVRHFLLAAGYKGESIAQYYHRHPRPGCRVEVVIEPAPLGTAGATRFVGSRLSDNFVLSYGDVFIDFDVRPMLASHRRFAPMGTLLVRASDHPWDSHLIDQDELARVRQFVHERQPGQCYHNVANAAFYILNNRILEFIPTNGSSDFGADIFPSVLRARGELRTHALPDDGFIKDMGTPERLADVEQYLEERRLARAASARPGKISTVLLDRDGVLNVDNNLIDRVDRLEMLPGAAEAVAMLNRAGIRCYLVTNQPALARGLCDEETLSQIHGRLQDHLASAGGKLEGIYYCPHHPETHHHEGIPALRRACRCRKPAPGLIFRAQREHLFDLGTAVMVGDRATDIQAGRAAGVRTVLVGPERQRHEEAAKALPNAQFLSLLAFAKAITTDRDLIA